MKRISGLMFLAVAVPMAMALSGCGDSGTTENDTIVGDEPVRLNEIDCHGTDWIEIANINDMVMDISGWYVSDSLDKTSHFYQLPANTIVKAHDYVVIKAEDTDTAGFGFGIKCDGESVYLLDSSKTVVDVTDLTSVPDGYTWGRFPDGTGDWAATLPTQLTANILTPDTPEELFDPSVVNLFAITLGTDAVTALGTDPYEYVAGTLSVTVAGETTTAQPVGVRLKSGYSFQSLDGKAAFKIKASDYADGDRILGLKNFTLNNMVDDQTMMHETLAYALFRAAGIPAPRTGYARVTVNGEDYGLYVLVESYDDQFTAQNFASTAHLYEGTADLYLGQIDKFDIEDGSETDTADLEALMAKIAAISTTWASDVADIADIDEMTSLWAIEHFVGHSDGYSLAANNYFLHSTDEGLFTMMPWGTDRTFIDTPTFGECSSIFCSACMNSTECKAVYDARLAAIPALVTTLDLAGMVTTLEAVVGSYVETGHSQPYTAAEHTAAVTALKSWIPARSLAVSE